MLIAVKVRMADDGHIENELIALTRSRFLRYRWNLVALLWCIMISWSRDLAISRERLTPQVAMQRSFAIFSIVIYYLDHERCSECNVSPMVCVVQQTSVSGIDSKYRVQTASTDCQITPLLAYVHWALWKRRFDKSAPFQL